MEINDILLEWSYRLPKGYPTMEDGKFTDLGELEVLRQILKENGVSEMPSFIKSKTPVSDIVVEAEEDGQQEDSEDVITPKDLEAALAGIRPETLSSKAIKLLYGQLQAFSSFKPIRQALAKKGYAIDVKSGKFDMPKQIANTLQVMLSQLKKDQYADFLDYLALPDEQQAQFPIKIGWSNFKQSFPKSIGPELEIGLASYTGQDEKKRGVGMGEILMSLAYGNIIKATGGGDLQIKGGSKLEVKGAGAILGALSPNLDNKVVDAFEGTGISFLGVGANFKPSTQDPENPDKQVSFNKSKLAQSLAIAAKNNENAVRKGFIKLVSAAESGMDKWAEEAARLVDQNGSWTNDADVNRAFGLANFMRYASKEGFGSFIAADYGSKGANNGQYLFVQGSPEEMASQLMKGKVGFEGASTSNIYPRVDASGGPSTSLKEDIEE